MRLHRRITAAAVIAACGGGCTAWLIACGPFLTGLETIAVVRPARVADFVRGDVGVVRPHLARRYLVQAYRTFSGRPAAAGPASGAVTPTANADREPSPAERWTELRDHILGPASNRNASTVPFSPYRRLPNTYQEFLNCGDDAFVTALRTARARMDRFGESSEEVRDWVQAQAAVFRNCAEETLVLPPSAGAGTDPLLQADRAYQSAAAYFYAMQYEEAARRFRAIADDRSSPWRPYGRYLAARAAIRFATVPDEGRERSAERFAIAEREIAAVLDDAAADPMHGAAKDLLGFVNARLHPVAHLHEISSRMTNAPQIADRDLGEYTWLMDRFVGDTVEYHYDALKDRDALIAGDDLTDWVLAMQDGRPAAAPRALARWQATRSMPWLVAALWTVPPDDASVSPLLDASRTVEPSSPAYQTIAFLRVRLLAAADRRAEARAVLADLPAAGFQPEAVNLLNAERLMLARTFEEFLAAAPRAIVAFAVDDPLDPLPANLRDFDRKIFGEDAAVTFNGRMPLDRLVAAAESRILPDHLRLSLAGAAFSRAVLLQRGDAATAAARILRALAPRVRGDIDRVLAAATAADRQHAAVLLLLRTPGIHATVNVGEDDLSYAEKEPARTFDHLLRRNWWCGVGTLTGDQMALTSTDWVARLYPAGRLPFPEFISDAERTKVDEERRAMAATGAGRAYLASEAIQWAESRPRDVDAAEALALAVEGWRWSYCTDEDRSALPQRAFQTLHRLFPSSEWAKRTRYWFR